MSYAKILMSAAVVSLMSTSAFAQIQTVVEPVPTQTRTLDQLPVVYSDQGIMQAQHIRPGDVSPEEYAALLAEAEKVQAFQTNSGNYADITYDTSSYVSAPAIQQDAGYEIQLFEEPIIQPAPVTYAAVPTTISVPVSQSYSVVKGDTLYNLSKRFGVSVDDIRNSNGLNGNGISLGQYLMIPSHSTTVSARSYQQAPVTFAASSSPAQTITAPAMASSSSRVIRTVQPIPGSGVHAVLPGDTLYNIAKRACVTVDGIKALNGVTDPSKLQLGQRLTMPQGHCLN